MRPTLRHLKWPMAWLALSFGIGAIGTYWLDVAFWPSVLLVGVALTANGALAYWEDRGKFND